MTEPTDISFDDAWAEADAAASVKTDEAAEPAAGVAAPADEEGNPAPAAVAAAPAAAAATQAQEDADEDAFDWNTIPEAVRGTVKGRLDAEKQAREAAEHRARSDANRVSALQRKANDLERRLATSTPAPDLLNAALAGDKDQWAALEQDFPAIAVPLKAALGGVLKVATQQVVSAVQPLAQKMAQDDEASELAALEGAHAGWQQTIATPAFTEWLTKQAPGIQALADSDHAADAAALLDQFKLTTAPATPASQPKPSAVVNIKQQRAQRVAQAATAPVALAAAHPGRAEIPDDWDAAWEAYDRRDAASAKK